jgi:hypothetical protein
MSGTASRVPSWSPYEAYSIPVSRSHLVGGPLIALSREGGQTYLVDDSLPRLGAPVPPPACSQDELYTGEQRRAITRALRGASTSVLMLPPGLVELVLECATGTYEAFRVFRVSADSPWWRGPGGHRLPEYERCRGCDHNGPPLCLAQLQQVNIAFDLDSKRLRTKKKKNARRKVRLQARAAVAVGV